MAVTLRDLVREIPGASLRGEAGSVIVRGVKHDSRLVEPGELFVARPGANHDGAAFIDQAVSRGANVVLAKRGVAPLSVSVPVIEVDDVPRALAFAAAAAYGHPTFGLDVVGITGTNGKTTTAHLAAKCIEVGGGRPAIIGTLGYRFEDFFVDAKHTSPEADEIARLAAEMKTRGASHLVMEVSSIALAAARADAVRFRVAAFTNLTQDHLDFHGTMSDYAAAKTRLFVDLGPSSAAINVDDAFGAELDSKLAYGLRKLRYSTKSTNRGAGNVVVERAEHRASGIVADVSTPMGRVEIASTLVGAHNVENLLCAVSIACLLDIPLDAISRALSSPINVPGRLERCDEPGVDDITVVVDYAHTPDALARVLVSARAMTRGDVTCVFGCGGDRDPVKRPLMGEAVGCGADRAFVTNDNPRSEEPSAIIEAILPGLRSGNARFDIEPDRARAIAAAIAEAKAGDAVVIAGKGHETYQIIGNVTHDFDDRIVARAALAERRNGRGKKAS